ncbi:putative plant self-incompatibility S1 [Helianthus anomalus]
MSIFVTKKLLFLFISLSYFTCFLITPSHSRPCWGQEWTVFIYNGIWDSTIDIHVISGDDDLGHHNITYELGYRFNFCDNIFTQTVFGGDFSHGSQFVHFNVFDSSVEEFIGAQYGQETGVYWLLKEDGYYLSKEYKGYDDPVWKHMGNWQ